MKQRYNNGIPYKLTQPPKALVKAKLDTIAIVPASMLSSKAKWQRLANTLPQGAVLLYHSQKNTRQKKLLERVAELLQMQGHQVTNLPLQ
jgi:hypothetical protein